MTVYADTTVVIMNRCSKDISSSTSTSNAVVVLDKSFRYSVYVVFKMYVQILVHFISLNGKTIEYNAEDHLCLTYLNFCIQHSKQ